MLSPAEVRRWRRMGGYSQEEAGAMMFPPVSRTIVQRWECGVARNGKYRYPSSPRPHQEAIIRQDLADLEKRRRLLHGR